LIVSVTVLAPGRSTHLQGTIGDSKPSRGIPQISVTLPYRDTGRRIGGGLADFL
jgi:hypothetical protein